MSAPSTRLNKGDPTSAIRRSSAQGTTVLLGDPHVAGREPTVVCTWCSQRGHIEGVCVREPRCARCFDPHPERNHDAVVRAGRAHFPPKLLMGRPIRVEPETMRHEIRGAKTNPGHHKMRLLGTRKERQRGESWRPPSRETG